MNQHGSRSIRLRLEPLEARCLPSVNVLTYHNDLARTGQNLTEAILTPADVTSAQFGKLFSYSVDGQVYAQPLYLSNLTIPARGPHNVVFAATEHDSVYAFDADSNQGGNATPLWHDSFINPALGVTTVSSSDINCNQITPEIGITDTPVIDPATNTMYLVAMTKETTGSTTSFVQRLHALDVTTGAEKFGGPVVVQASVPGPGGTNVVFNPKDYKERPGLLLLNGVVYTSWSSHCDIGTYHGWIMGYNAQTLQQVSVFNVTPDGNQASVWASGAAPAADAAGNLYFTTGNGTFDASTGGRDYGDSALKLSSASSLSVADYFTPFDQSQLQQQDLDLGSGGVLLLPDAAGSAAHPHLLVTAGKNSVIYLIDRDNMGRFNAAADNVVQELANSAEYGAPAYFNNLVYFGGNGDTLKAFSISGAALSTNPSSQAAQTFGYPGTTPSISANGTANGIVWAIQKASHAILRAYNATNLAQELYDSDQAGGRDQLDAAIKFSVPTIANGKVFVGTNGTLTVFGLFGKGRLATGAGPGGGPEVKVFGQPTGAVVLDFFPYNITFTGGVRVATGDVNGDGVPDIVTAPGPGGGPDVRIFDGNTGALIGEIVPYPPDFVGGVYVAVGDVNHDGLADVITGAGQGGGPELRVFTGPNFAPLYDFFPYNIAFTGGVRVAAGDTNIDGFADIITGAGPGGGPHVQVFSGKDLSRLQSLFAYAPNFAGGVFVAAGDTDGDGHADIITGAGSGGGPHVKVFSGATGALLQSFLAYNAGFTGGVEVAAADVNGDGKIDIITGAGPGGGPDVRAFDGKTLALLDEFFAYSTGFSGGVFVGGS